MLFQQVRQAADQFVPRFGALGFIYRPQIVDVRADHPDGGTVIPAVIPPVAVIAAAVEQSGQRIVVNAVLQLSGIFPMPDLPAHKVRKRLRHLQGLLLLPVQHHQIPQLPVRDLHWYHRHAPDPLALHILIKLKGLRKNLLGSVHLPAGRRLHTAQPFLQMLFHGASQLSSAVPAAHTGVTEAVLPRKHKPQVGRPVMSREHIRRAAQRRLRVPGLRHGIEAADDPAVGLPDQLGLLFL